MGRVQRRRSRNGQKAPVWFGAIFVLAGCAIIGVGGGIIPVDPSSVHAPGWVIVLCGVVFALGGVMACLGGDGAGDETLNAALALLFMVCLASAFSWVAFGPGERQFSGGGSVGPVGAGGSVGETVGRVAFGFGSVLMWAFVLAIASKLLKSVRSAS
ncbi:MAG: hypothetical protein OEU54_11290 [Gemmatimonadota bacterium]|nr:hypothetical protein [Gemmatimonadota bacterium]